VAKSDGLVVDGHLRLKAAKKLGMAEVPVILADDMTEAQIKAFRISVNRMAEFAEWDNELLALEFAELTDMEFDLDLTGFTADEIAALTPEQIEPGLTDEDAVPEPPAQPVTVQGDVWVLGKHRLMCGDSTSIDAVDTLMAGKKADMVFTDPPYGIDVGNQSQGKGGGVAKKINYGENEWDKSIPYEAINTALSLSDCCVLWGANYYADRLPPSSCWIVWDKDNGESDFADVELAWTSYKKAARLFKWKWAGMIQQDMKNKEKRVHPTQKPTALAEWTFKKFNAGSVIVDLFGGSGSTLIACEKTGRQARLMELDPKYCDVIVKRWQDFTGKIATHAETGEPFAEVTNGNNETKT
jgi:DNA modification methylase